ncbi:MAG: BatA domain-containing protein, partial [Mangrovicoccus sp.]
MLQLGALGFTSPFLLLALLALPLLWVILRAVPPAPIRRKFPGVALLLGLADDEVQSDRTPWWLLLLRMAAVALVILGFAGPVLNPQQSQPGTGPLLIVLDGTWADARDWPRRMERVEAALTEAGREGRPVALAVLTDLPTEDLPFQSAETWLSGLPGLKPNPWLPQAEDLARFSEMLAGQRFDTFWLSDGLDHSNRPDGADHAALLAQFEAAGQVRIFESPRPVQGLTPARFEEGDIALTALRSWPGPNDMVTVIGRGTDPNGIERVLVREELRFEGGALAADLALSLPAELRNRLTRFEIEAERSAAAVSLTDDSLRRREVALFAGRASDEAFELLSPLHYLEQALAPTADLLQGSMVDVLQANPDVIIFADVARLAEAEEQALAEWVEAGGLLLRFAGPRLA